MPRSGEKSTHEVYKQHPRARQKEKTKIFDLTRQKPLYKINHEQRMIL